MVPASFFQTNPSFFPGKFMSLRHSKFLWIVPGVCLGAVVWMAFPTRAPEKKTLGPAAHVTRTSDPDPASGEAAVATDASGTPADGMSGHSAPNYPPMGASAAGAGARNFVVDGAPETEEAVSRQTPDRQMVPAQGAVPSPPAGGSRTEPGSSGFAGVTVGSAADNREIAVAVPPGERAPAVFYDETPRPEPQLRMLDEIARGFNEAIQREVSGYTAEEVWREARDWADERYMYFFGWDAWNALHLQAAQEAVREKEALGQMFQRSYEE